MRLSRGGRGHARSRYISERILKKGRCHWVTSICLVTGGWIQRETCLVFPGWRSWDFGETWDLVILPATCILASWPKLRTRFDVLVLLVDSKGSAKGRGTGTRVVFSVLKVNNTLSIGQQTWQENTVRIQTRVYRVIVLGYYRSHWVYTSVHMYIVEVLGEDNTQIRIAYKY